MKSSHKLTITLFAGVAISGLAIHVLHAQAKPPVYYISEVTPTDMDTYTQEYTPKARAALKAAGGRTLAAGKAIQLEGDAPKPRTVIIQWDSMEQLQAWRSSAAFKELLQAREKLAKVRAFAIEGVSTTGSTN